MELIHQKAITVLQGYKKIVKLMTCSQGELKTLKKMSHSTIGLEDYFNLKRLS